MLRLPVVIPLIMPERCSLSIRAHLGCTIGPPRAPFGKTPLARTRPSPLNSFFVLLGIESWKPLFAALALPPVPLLLLALWGGWRIARRRRLGATLLCLSVALLWLSHCAVTGHWLSRWLLSPPPALSAERIAELRAQAVKNKTTAILVLGGGAEALAPEYGVSNLTGQSVERLRYGVWLARATGLPLGFSGGVGWGAVRSQSEAQVAERIAKEELGVPLRWAEGESRDTRENATLSIALLRRAGITHIVLVTHDWHMPRSLRSFQHAAAQGMTIEAAPMGLSSRAQLPSLAWLPSGEGTSHVRRVLREALGSLMGA
jgi:uncharacterized SAM-binding protein YcdF (DUF218 family)